MTNKNSPNVKRVTGNVNKTNTGFTNTLSNPKTIETIKADSNPSISTPFIR